MHFVILGAGALGSIYAAYLARAGHQVSLIARGERAAALSMHGIGIVGDDSFSARCSIVTQPQTLRQADVVIVSVKTYDTAQALALDSRTHVAIDDATGAAKEGGLFRSAGVEFGPQFGATANGMTHALAVSVESSVALQGHHRRVGGEGRPARIAACTPPDIWPCATPAGLAAAKRIRLMLISPAVFPSGGFVPDGFESDKDGIVGTLNHVRLRIFACALDRAGTYSGWQVDGPGRAYRVVPAGTVYWCDVLEGGDPTALWNRSLCPAPWNASGWGYVVAGHA